MGRQEGAPEQAAALRRLHDLAGKIAAKGEFETKLRRLNESFGGEHEKVEFDRGPVGI